MKWSSLVLTAMMFTFTACNKSSDTGTTKNTSSDTAANILTYQIEGVNPQISFSSPDIVVQFPDTVINPGNLVANFTLSPGATATIQGVAQTSGVSVNDFGKAMVYNITSPSGTSKNWEVIGTNNNYTVNWSLGQWLQKSASNNRDYNWYIDQSATDNCGDINCGPTCVTMAIKWADSTYTGTVTEARTFIRSGCGTWSTFNIIDFLNYNNVPFSWIPLPDSATQMRDNFKNQLDSGRILIIELVMSAVRESANGINSRTDKFYNGDFNHFIILKGYRQVDGVFYFEVYDPWDLGEIYKDGTPVGENRFYRYDDIFNGCSGVGAGGTGIAEIVVSPK